MGTGNIQSPLWPLARESKFGYSGRPEERDVSILTTSAATLQNK